MSLLDPRRDVLMKNVCGSHSASVQYEVTTVERRHDGVRFTLVPKPDPRLKHSRKDVMLWFTTEAFARIVAESTPEDRKETKP